MELNAALDAGYVATKIFRVLEYKDWDDTLFQGYVREFYKIKLESSGFPEGINTPELQQQFILECKTIFGIDIDVNNMRPNPAMRTLSKICLNSLWGRFSLRNSLSKSLVTDDLSEVKRMLNDMKIAVTQVEELDDNIWMITYKTKTDFIEEHNCSNLVISLWTTSAARLHLLKVFYFSINFQDF